jgi:hypothetical protein
LLARLSGRGAERSINTLIKLLATAGKGIAGLLEWKGGRVVGAELVVDFVVGICKDGGKGPPRRIPLHVGKLAPVATPADIHRLDVSVVGLDFWLTEQGSIASITEIH